TYRIEKTLAEWVEDGRVAPGRILAVTFTEAAASELRGRIRDELMRRGRIDDALEIDRAYVGTIHALGQRLLTEHAFAAGRSPQNRLLSESERDLLIRREMARCSALKPLMQDLRRYGYAWNPMSGASAEESFRADLLRTVDLLRGLGARGQSPEILDSALEALDAGYGDRAADGTPLTEALRRAAQDLLASFPRSLAPEAGNDTARKAFAKDHTNLRRAADSDALERDWVLWQALRALRLGNSRSPTPPGYDQLASEVIAAANELLRHPGPLEDARAHLTALVTGAQEVLAAYQDAKRDAGLIDYADMIVEAETLLRTRPVILNAVLAEIDCVVIDEFQDTNPVQFALLWRLANGAGRALIVGDTKQSIMGFQGADPRLSQALQGTHPEAADPLDRNWRSDPRIMDVINTLGPALFPDSYDPLAPTREATGATALEAIALPRSWIDRKNHTPDCIADRVTNLLSDGEKIWDKGAKRLRPARPSDVAVLAYTAGNCAAIADALRARGLPVRIQGEGWLSSPVMRAARAALAYIADPADRHAALTWLTLGPPTQPLQDALISAADHSLDTHVALEALRALHPQTESRPVGDLVTTMIDATGLRDWAAGLADAAQGLADLTRLEAEAQEFDRLALDLRAAAGFHGCGPQVFLGWILAQTDKTWDRHPDPSGWSGTGIEITTWHSAKGREWPITVVAGLDFKFPERPGTLRAEFNSFDDLDNVLDHAGLAWLPDFAAPEKQQAFADALIEADEQDAARELYVALTRARDRLILALPATPSKEKERPERMVDLLRARAGMRVDGGALTICGKAFPARIIQEPRDREFPDPTPVTEPPVARFGHPAPCSEGPRTPWRRRPSALESTGMALPRLTHVPVAAGLAEQDDGFVEATERGTAWHLAFRVLCDRPALRDRLEAASRLDTATLDAIAAQAVAIRDWLADRGYVRLHFELPVQQLAPDGSETNAIIDCLAEGPEGCLILDHKSGPCPDPEARFAEYLPQLTAYATLIEGRGDTSVREIAINWMREGIVSVAPTKAMEST
ncbi:MAG: UvrD-helicase domain-containing protein, partial [Rhodovulum sp.]